MNDVTQLLEAIQHGDPAAADHLLPMVYDELRRLARSKLAAEPSGHSLQPTALVHEAYLRLVDVKKPQAWNSKGHFFAAAALAMRRILIENARKKKSQRRGGGWQKKDLTKIELTNPNDSDFLIALDESLDQLSHEHPNAAQVVCLRFFAGLSIEQTSEALNVSARTVNRDWLFGKTWLFDRLSKEQDG